MTLLHLPRTSPLHLFPPVPSLSSFSPSRCLPLFIPLLNRTTSFPLFPTPFPKFQSQGPRVFSSSAEKHAYHEEEQKGSEGIEVSEEAEDLGVEGEVFKKTLRLVECSMFASVSGLAYILSNTLAIENYFGCFFPLPIVMSSMRWGVASGRKTMVATSLLLFTLSGPIKASSYLLMYGLVGLTMGSLWKLEMDWGLSIVLCTLVRTIGVLGYVLLTSFLIRENILSLITVNTHAGVTYALTSIGLNTIPSMWAIFILFGCLLLVNCGFFVFLLHIIYAVLLSKLGMKASWTLPRWLEKSL